MIRWLVAAALTVVACGEPPAPALHPPARAASANGIDGAAWLAPDAVRARAAGAGPLEVLAADVASEGDRVGAFVDLAAGACVLGVTRSSPQVIDVDLFAYEEDGSLFAADESPDAQAAVLLCSKTPRRLYVAARVIAGAGIVAVGAFVVPKGAEGRARGAFTARTHGDDDAGRAEGFPGLEARIASRRAALGGRWDELRRVSVPLDPHAATRLSAAVEAGRCLDVLVAASEEVPSFDVAAEDERGRIVATGRAVGRDRALVLCADTTTSIDLTIRPRSSQGLAAVSLGRSQRGGDAELAPSVRALHLTPAKDLGAARAALDAALRARGYGPGRQLAAGVAKIGVRASAALDLPAGCARLDVVVGRPFAELAAALWDDNGQLIAEARAGGGAPLFACGKGGQARVDLEPLEGAGPFAVELRTERASPPALVAHPIATARLLGRLAQSGSPVASGDVADVRVVSLDRGSLKTLPVAVPAQGCAEVFAALDAGGAGIDLRVVEPRRREGDVARARYVTSNRLCAGAGGAQGSIELRLDAGRADALVWVRPSAP